MNSVIIESRTDLEVYLDDVRYDLHDYRDAIATQILHSDHPAWGSDWSCWLADLEDLYTEVVESIDAIAETESM